MKKIAVLVGSARKHGNTDQIADAFIQGATEEGNICTKVYLGEKNIQGCRGCNYCQNNNHQCIIQDAMQEYYPLFLEADVVVFTSPLYFWTISSWIKTFIDRLYAISVDDQYPRKETVLLMSAGDDHFWTFEQAISYYRFLTKALGWKNLGMVCAGGCEIHNNVNKQYLTEAYQIGKSI